VGTLGTVCMRLSLSQAHPQNHSIIHVSVEAADAGVCESGSYPGYSVHWGELWGPTFLLANKEGPQCPLHG
jgi:hypothetical protein